MFKHFAFLSLTLFSLITSHAFAHKNVGGGNGVGGVLFDRVEYETSQEISDEAFALVHDTNSKLFKDIPFLEKLAIETFLVRKTTYIGHYTFIDACKNETLIDANQVVIACQNDVEIRIQKTWWEKATSSAKADLLVHELLRSYWLETPSERSINAAVYALLRKDASIFEINKQLARAELPPLFSARSQTLASAYLQTLLNNFCESETASQARAAYKSVSDDFQFREMNFDQLAQEKASRLPLEAPEAFYLFQITAGGLLERGEYGKDFCKIQSDESRADFLLWDAFKRHNDLYQAL